MDYKEILLGLLSKTHKMTNKEITDLIHNSDGELKDDALNVLVDNDISRIGKIKESIKLNKDEIYGQAKRETLTKGENQMKEFFGVKSDKKGDDLLKEIKTKISDNKGSGELTDEDVKNHALYQKVLTGKTEDIAKLNSDWEVKLNNIEKETNQKAIFHNVNSKALAIAKGFNPVISKNPEIAQRQLSRITSALKKYEFEQSGDTFIVKQDGKIKEDEHANQVTFGDLIKGITERNFDLDVNQERSGTGNDNNNGSGASGNQKVTSMDELREKMKNAKTQEEREQLTTNFKKSQEEKKD